MTETKDTRVALTDDFRGDTLQLISSIRALIGLSDDGALVPHGLGGHARGLLSAAAVRLAQSAPSAPHELTAKIAALYEPTTKDLDLGKLGVVRGGEFHQYTNGSGQSQTAMFTGAESISPEERDANAAFYVGIHALVPEILSALLAAPAAAPAPQEPIALPERVIDVLWQQAGLTSFHPDGDQQAKFHMFANLVTIELWGRLPTAHSAAPRQPGEMVAGVQSDGVRWDMFPAWLIDHCEGETITEEGMQSALADMLEVYPATKAASAQQDEREAEMRAAWKKQTGEEWLGGAGITRTLWAAAWRAAQQMQADAVAVPNGWTLVPVSPHIGLLSTGGFYAAAACCDPSMTARHLYECVLQEARERYQKEFRMPMPVAPLTAAREGDPK